MSKRNIAELPVIQEIVKGLEDRPILLTELTPEQLGYSCARILVPPGGQTVRFRLRTTTDFIIILQGSALAEIDGQPTELTTDDTLFIPAGTVRVLYNKGTSDLYYLSIVSPAWDQSDCEII